jgi:hypothetical protein
MVDKNEFTITLPRGVRSSDAVPGGTRGGVDGV